MKLDIVTALCLVSVALVMSASGAPTSEEPPMNPIGNSSEGVRADFSPAKLFDFNNYKKLFHKTYSGVLDELVRAKYFLSRAFRAFVSAIKYKHRQSHFYLAVNEMSDWTPEEIERAQNKVLARSSIARLNKGGSRQWVAQAPKDDLPELLPGDVEGVERELQKLAERELASGSQTGNATRDLPVSKLIETGADVQLNAKAARKLVARVPSNNANYEPPELASFGLRDEYRSVNYWMITQNQAVAVDQNSASASDFKQAAEEASRSAGNQAIGQDSTLLADELFVDLRETGCLTLPRQQGKCGSCWAFAATTIFEYLHCMKTGKLVPFSEQYMIDCGRGYIEGAEGCEGGTDQAASNFVKNLGLELRSNYPYSMHENQCPYEESTELKRTGYIRFEFGNAVGIAEPLWPRYVTHSPLFVGISLPPGFSEYGGGIFGWGCDKKVPTHAVVLVGHGRQDGYEYWLIRNSHSSRWGEGGYAKLAKVARCTAEHIGYTFATNDGHHFSPEVQENEHHDPELIRLHLENQMDWE